ncbi:hypothetical protein [Thalassospira sp.]|uniref:hypothetical protein n=1 Tax=Thalassospira sp. TaxID=1912094 RepID=UPI001AFE1EB2|nr:hypothetical protein [Thalassospira sp.]MBO6806229.1 hypothetical protein [Thalassospira sp.]
MSRAKIIRWRLLAAAWQKLSDDYPAAFAWLGVVRGHAVALLGVSAFGQCGDSIVLYDHYQIGTEAILRAVKRQD